MKNFVRGGIALTMVGMLVVFIYAQTRSEKALSSANDSQTLNNFDNNLADKNLVKANLGSITDGLVADRHEEVQVQDSDDKNSKIKKTVSTRSTAGASRGTFTATAYCLKGRTAMGHGVRRGLIAADPRVLKLGSQINLGAGSYSGQYLVSDTGGGVKGRRIDIWMPSCAEARRFGRRTVTISVL